MKITDLLGYKLTCRMSSGLKNDPNYTEDDFSIIIEADDKFESGYKATFRAYTEDEGDIEDVYDAKSVYDNIFWGNWDIKDKEKIN